MKRIKAVKIPKNGLQIGFIGQGYVGRNYADDFEKRGFSVVRYSIEEEFRGNKEKIKECDFVFIAVPTPSTPDGFDGSIVEDVLSLVGKGKTAIIKSTVPPGATEALQKRYPELVVLNSPEFLTEATAAFDAAHPKRNIIGMPEETKTHQEKAKELLQILPRAPYELVTESGAAELVKYAGNCFLFFKVLFANMFYDLAEAKNIPWDTVAAAVGADDRIGPSHLRPIHSKGRGAGGHCLIKDFAAFAELYKEAVGEPYGVALLKSLEEKNAALLLGSGKDRDLLEGVYGSEFLARFKGGR